MVLLENAWFWEHIYATVYRTALSSILASAFGITMGLAMGWNSVMKRSFGPLFSAIYPLPAVALLPLMMLLFGMGNRAFILTAALGAFFLMLWNALNGARSIKNVYFDVARDNGVTSTRNLFREVLLPGTLPHIFTGLRLCVSTSLMLVVSIELVAGNSGLGYFLWRSWSVYMLPNVYSTVLVIGIIGVLITYGLQFLSDRLIPWKQTPAHGFRGMG